MSFQPTLEEFIALLTQACSLASEEVTSTADVDCPDSLMLQLLRKAERVTKGYRTQGKLHHHPMQLKHLYRIIREYHVRLQRENWQDLCQELEHESGLSRLRGFSHIMNGNVKVRLQILDEMCLQMNYSQVQDTSFTRILARRYGPLNPAIFTDYQH